MSNELRFDWFPVIESKGLDELVEKLAYQVLAPDRGRTGKRADYKHKATLGICKQVISALYVAHSAPFSSSSISFPLRSSSYSPISNEPGKIWHSYDYSKNVYDTLLEMEWTEVTKKPHDRSHTRIACCGELRDKFDEMGLKWLPQKLVDKEELIVLRDVERGSDGRPTRDKSGTKKFDLPVPSSPEVDMYRDNLREINTLLGKHCVHLDLDYHNLELLCKELSFRASTNPLDRPGALILQNTQLYRIFSRGSMEKGGRFYRGWWQSIPSVHRPHIRINGKNTVEVDYSAMALRIIYAQLGLAFDPDADPYDIGLVDWLGKTDPRRKVIKKAFNALINDEDGVYRLGPAEQKSLGMSDKEFRDLVSKKHPEIAKHFGTDIGLKAQFTDSQIAEAVMLDMLRNGIPILPIHDSFIVSAGNQHILQETMNHHFKEITGSDGSVEAEVVKQNEHFGLRTDELEELSTDPEHYAINGTDIELDELLKPITSTIMGKFESGWLECQ